MALTHLVHQLNRSFRGLYMAFYLVNIYFMYSHFLALLFPPVTSYAYLAYQVKQVKPSRLDGDLPKVGFAKC